MLSIDDIKAFKKLKEYNIYYTYLSKDITILYFFVFLQ